MFYLCHIAELQNLLVEVLHQRIFVLVNLANVDWIGLDEGIVSAVNLTISCGLNLLKERK